MSQYLLKDRTGKPPFVEPFLRALDRIQGELPIGPEALTGRASKLLHEMSRGDEASAVTNVATGPTGIIGSHTHYFDGFALLLSLPFGTAVSARAVSEGPSEIVFEGSDQVWRFSLGTDREPDSDHPVWVRIVEDILRAFPPDAEAVRIAISTTIFPQCFDAYVAALGAAVSGVALQLSKETVSERERLLAVRRIIEGQTGLPFGVTYLIAAIHGGSDRYILVDGSTHEFLPVEAPARNEIGWGMMYMDGAESAPASHDAENKAKVEEALVLLQEKAFPTLPSFRELEHRDLQRALGTLPERLTPAVRHLVTENRRVQKVVMALRKRDWQFVGALLVMSHASLRSDWKGSTTHADLIVEQAESMSIEGVYGAAMTSRGGTVLVCGQPFIVPQFIERVAEPFRKRFGALPTSMLLPDSDSDQASNSG